MEVPLATSSPFCLSPHSSKARKGCRAPSLLRTRTTSTCRTTRVSASTRGGPSCDVARLHRRDSASSRTNRTTHNSLVSHHQRQHRISHPPSLPPCKRRRHMGYHNTRGNPTAGRNARILARENYCVSASPGRAGFSIFCQIITSPNLCQARLFGTHPIRLHGAFCHA